MTCRWRAEKLWLRRPRLGLGARSCPFSTTARAPAPLPLPLPRAPAARLLFLEDEGRSDRERWLCERRGQQPPVSLLQLQAAVASPAGDRRRRSADPARLPARRRHRRTHTRIRAHTHSQLAAAAAAMLASRLGKFPAGPGHGPQCSQVSASRTLRASPGRSAG